MVRAMESLFSLGAISEDTSLTSPDGLRMAELPVASAMARSLLWAAEKGCADEMCTIAAALSVPSLFASVRGGPKAQEESKARFWVAEGDMITALNVYQAWEAAGRAPKFAHRTGVSHKALLRASDIRGQIRR